VREEEPLEGKARREQASPGRQPARAAQPHRRARPAGRAPPRARRGEAMRWCWPRRA